VGPSVHLTRNLLHRHWRSLPIALLTAIVSSLVLWSVTTARRIDTAFDRVAGVADALRPE
jgi:hypothetical protein